MANCNDYISADDLKTGKQAILHIEHVAKSRDAAGNPALDVADTIRGQSVTNKTLDGLENLYNQAISQVGYITMDSFEDGATLTLPNQVLRYKATGEYYRWDGGVPKTVSSGSTPETAGGIGLGAWVSVGDAALRTELGKSDGFSFIGEGVYADIRNYTGSADKIFCKGREHILDGGQGIFYVDLNDSSTPDDDGVVLIDSLNRRWKRNYDGPIMASWYGVNDGEDVSAELQRMFTKGGGQIFVKDGQYTLSSTVVSDHTGASYPVMARKSTRFDFIGSSMTNTVFNTSGITGLSFIGTDGTVAGQGVHSGMKIKDFSVYGTSNTGTGIRLTGAAYLKVEDLYLVRHNAGMVMTGVLSSDIKRINAQYNNYGIYINTGTNSTFNAMRISGMFGGNSVCGIEGEVGTNVYIEDSNFEGNGTNGLVNSGAIYLRVKEPLSTINISAYFEANIGDADITIDNLTSSPVVVNLRGCVFNRGGGAGGGNAGLGCNYNFQAKSTGGGKVILNLDGCVFFTQTASGYTPSSAKPYILKAPYLVVNGEDTCYFSETTSRGETGNRSLSLGLSVNADGTCANNPPFITVTRVSAGVYTINHSDQFAPDTGHFQVVATSKASGTRVYYAQKVNLQSIRVVTVDNSNSVTDAAFDVVITSRR